MGLGPFSATKVVETPEHGDPLTLDQARDKAMELRRLVKRGIHPLAQREAERASNQGKLPEGKRHIPTFAEVAGAV
jgi:hypothetical protein